MIIVGGATATGKTAFAYMLAKKLDTALISADSMQIYKGMDIGTAKDKNLDIKQYCIDIVSPTQQFTVVDYKENALIAINEVESFNKLPIVVGGTGFYIDSLIFDKGYGGNYNEKLRKELASELEKVGAYTFHQKLKEVDPVSASVIHPNNSKRVLRALEVSLSTGKPFSSQNSPKEPIRDYKMYVLTSPRALLYQRIDDRVDKMIGEGLEKELEFLLENGADFTMQSMQGIGYKEWKDYFKGRDTIMGVSEKIKKNTKAYSKRQQTWFNNQYKDDIHYIDINDDLDKTTDNIAHSILN